MKEIAYDSIEKYLKDIQNDVYDGEIKFIYTEEISLFRCKLEAFCHEYDEGEDIEPHKQRQARFKKCTKQDIDQYFKKLPKHVKFDWLEKHRVWLMKNH